MIHWNCPVTNASGDGEAYKQIAVWVAQGKGFYHGRKIAGDYLRSYRPPLTPLVAAGLLKLFNGEWWSVYLFLCLIGAATCLNMSFIANKIFGKMVGVISGVLAAIYPMFVFLPSVLLTENLSLFFYSLAFLLIFKLVEEGSLKLAGMLGVALGLETLNKPTMAIFVVLLGGYIYFSMHDSKKRRFASVVIIFLTSFLVVLPWTIRKYRIHHRLVPIATYGGIAFWEGHNKYIREGWRPSYFNGSFPDEPSSWDVRNEVEWDRMGYVEGWKFIVHNPLLDLKHDLRKLLAFWSPYEHIIDKLTYIPVLILSLIGIYLTRREARKLLPFYLLTFYLTSLSVIYMGLPRYRMPVMIFLIIMAAVALERFLHYAKIKIEEARK
jgi:4-amino-4-deoxy-L-arabinose transferase-like glycosyltransferase